MGRCMPRQLRGASAAGPRILTMQHCWKGMHLMTLRACRFRQPGDSLCRLCIKNTTAGTSLTAVQSCRGRRLGASGGGLLMDIIASSPEGLPWLLPHGPLRGCPARQTSSPPAQPGTGGSELPATAAHSDVINLITVMPWLCRCSIAGRGCWP